MYDDLATLDCKMIYVSMYLHASLSGLEGLGKFLEGVTGPSTTTRSHMQIGYQIYSKIDSLHGLPLVVEWKMEELRGAGAERRNLKRSNSSVTREK